MTAPAIETTHSVTSLARRRQDKLAQGITEYTQSTDSARVAPAIFKLTKQIQGIGVAYAAVAEMGYAFNWSINGLHEAATIVRATIHALASLDADLASGATILLSDIEKELSCAQQRRPKTLGV